MAALNYLNKEQASNYFNLGNGEGFSVEEVIDAVKKVTGKNFDVVYENRREGDPAILVADSKLARQALDWQPRYTDLETIIRHAWQFEQKK
jgi:UDP-glucose 4-epimerase